MDINIKKIIDTYLNQTEKYIIDGNKNKLFSSDELSSISNNCLKEITNYLQSSYNIRNLSFKDDLLNLTALKCIYDELGFRYSKVMFDEVESPSYKTDVKSRLFMMILKTLDEIIYLLEGGYAVAATARFRYIYESCVFLEIIQKNNESFAERYFIESSKSQYKLASELGLTNLQNSIKKYIKGKVSLKKYFKKYNWAKNYIGKDNPSFYDLAQSTKYKKLYVLYVSSCHYVHSDLFGSICAIDKAKDEPSFTWYTEPSVYGTKKVLFEINKLLPLCIYDYFDKTSSPITCLAIGLLMPLVNFKH